MKGGRSLGDWGLGKMIGIADVAALVTVAGIGVYVVGLLGLAMAMRLRLIDNLSTAWFVVSLLPRTVVAGQGVRIWLAWPIPFAALLVVLDLSVLRLTNSRDMALAVLDRTSASLGFGFLSIYLVLVLASIQSTQREKHNRNLAGHFVVVTFVAAFGGFLMSQGALAIVRGLEGAAAHGMDLSVTGVLPIHGVLSGAMIFLVGGFLVGVPAAATIDHPLPWVGVSADPTVGTEESLVPIPDRLYLVGHVDGTWHFIDEERDVLLCIPDKAVTCVRTCRKPFPRCAGYVVYDQAYETIGKCDLLVSDEYGQPEYMVVRMGLLRLRFTLIPFHGAHVYDDRQKIMVTTSKEMVKKAPVFDDVKNITAKVKEEVRSYYELR